MRKLAALVLGLAVAGLLAATSVGAPPAATHAARVAEQIAKPAPKCLKYAKKHGKKVCVKRAKPKPKPKPKPVGGDGSGDGGGTTPPAGPVAGNYTGVSSQNASIQFTVSGAILDLLVVGEIDTTCTPGNWEYYLYGNVAGGLALDTAGKTHGSVAITTTNGNTGTLVVDATVDNAGRASGTMSLTMNVGGTGGPYSCSSGTISWTAGTGAAAPPAPQHAKPGHYVGTTAQGAAFVFDIVPSGSILLMNNLSFPELDEDCDPGQVHVAIYDFAFNGFLVDAAGNLRIHYETQETDFSRTFSVLGNVDANGHASGTINDQEAFPYGGTNWTCASGAVSWTASLQ